MSPESSQIPALIQALVAGYQDSIFYLLLGLSALAFVVAEGLSFLKVASEGRLKRALFHDPRAPFGWALIPAFLLILLAFVSWDRSLAPNKEINPFVGDTQAATSRPRMIAEPVSSEE